MENKTIFPIDEFIVSYKDNNFILISTTAEGYTYCYDNEIGFVFISGILSLANLLYIFILSPVI